MHANVSLRAATMALMAAVAACSQPVAGAPGQPGSRAPSSGPGVRQSQASVLATTALHAYVWRGRTPGGRSGQAGTRCSAFIASAFVRWIVPGACSGGE